MNWDNLRYFLYVAQAGSARAAALKMGVDQATVARRLHALETELNTQLFSRHRDGYQLTATGRTLLPAAKMMASSAQDIHKKLRGADAELSGTITLATTDVLARYFALNAIKKLSAVAPQIQFVVTADIRLQNLRQNDIDLAIRSERPTDKGLIVRHLTTTTLGLFASQRYLSRYGTPQPETGLTGHQFVIHHPQMLPDYWQSLCGEPMSHGNIALETNSQSLLIDAICQGLGIGILSADIVANRYPDLIPILPDRTERKSIWLVIHPDSYRSQKIKRFVEALTQQFERPSSDAGG